MSDPLRIGNAQAFWGDRTDAAAELLAREPDLDYLTLDYLAEVSLSILAVQRERDPQAGYARDFVEVVRSLAPYWAAGGRCRVITNAGGLNPAACAAACAAVLAEAGCPPLKLAIVTGDDVLPQLLAAAEDPAGRYSNLDSGRPLSEVRDRLVTANAYLGAAPLVEALNQGAQVVITGRVADPSLVVAPCRHHFGWTERDLAPLAGATIAGHLIECGTQVTGGIFTDWLSLPDLAHLGFPIVEVFADGSCIVTKPRGTGGRVNPWTVKEQLVYEIGDPARYLSPDVTVSFLELTVEDVGNDRVRVHGARGAPPPETLKVSATYRDGFRAAGMLTLCGREAVAKGRRCGEIVLQRLREAGHELRDSLVECLGTGEFAGGRCAAARETELVETVLRIAVESPSRAAVEQFTRELMPLITAGPPGTTGYAEGRPRVHPVFRYWPCLIDRERVTAHVDCVESPPPSGPLLSGSTATARIARCSPPSVVPGTTPLSGSTATAPTVGPAAAGCAPPRETANTTSSSPSSSPLPAVSGRLRDLACARSGDKGTSANLGVLARRAEDYPWLCGWLTAGRVAEFFAPLGVERVDRYELPNLQGLNFVLHGILRRSLRTDAQGKALAQALLDLPLPIDPTE